METGLTVTASATRHSLDLRDFLAWAEQPIVGGARARSFGPSDRDAGDRCGADPARIRRGLKHRPAERLIPAPDCGMKYLPRNVAFGKLKAMSDGAAIVRRELI